MKKSTYILIAAALALAVALAYVNGAKGEFIWDDINLIVMDYQIRDISFIGDIFTRDFFGFQDNARKYGYFRPLITLTFMLDYQLWGGLKPWGFHLTNIITHYFSTLFIFLIFLRLTGGKPLGPFIAALMFAVHPIHTESVTWIAGRTDTVCGVFFFLSLLMFMVWADRFARDRGYLGDVSAATPHRPQKGSKYRGFPLAVSFISFSLAMLAKEMAAFLPGVLFLYVFIFHTRTRWRRLLSYLPAFLGFIAILGGYGLYRYFVVDVSDQAKDPWGVVATMLSFVWTLTYYLLKMAWPVYQSGYIQNELVHSVFSVKVLVSFTVLCVIVWRMWVSWEKDRATCFALAFLLMSFLPLSNFVRISGPRDMGFMTAERFLYIPSAAFFLLIGIILSRLIGKIGGIEADRTMGGRFHSVGAVVIVLIVAGVYADRTIARNRVWYTNENFFKDAIKKAPTAPLLYMVLGNVYSLTNQWDNAEKTLNTAIEYLSPRDREEPTWIYSDLAGVYAKQRQYDKALEMMKLASRGRMHNSAVEFNMGEIYRMMGDNEKARDYYLHSLSIDQRNVKALEQLGFVLQQIGAWEDANRWYIALAKLLPKSARVQIQIGRNYMMLREFPRAVRHFQRAIDLNPKSAKGYEMLGSAYLGMEKPDVGIRYLRKAVELHPADSDAKTSLGNALFSIGQKIEAHQVLLDVLKTEPNNVKALLGMGILASDQNQPEIALKTFQRVLILDPDNLGAMISLGIQAQKEGKSEEAVRWFDEVLKRDKSNKAAITYLAQMGHAIQPAKEGAGVVKKTAISLE